MVAQYVCIALILKDKKICNTSLKSVALDLREQEIRISIVKTEQTNVYLPL